MVLKDDRQQVGARIMDNASPRMFRPAPVNEKLAQYLNADNISLRLIFGAIQRFDELQAVFANANVQAKWNALEPNVRSRISLTIITKGTDYAHALLQISVVIADDNVSQNIRTYLRAHNSLQSQ